MKIDQVCLKQMLTGKGTHLCPGLLGQVIQIQQFTTDVIEFTQWTFKTALKSYLLLIDPLFEASGKLHCYINHKKKKKNLIESH